MKKIVISAIIVLILLLSFGTAFAVEQVNSTETATGSELMEIKEKTKTKIDEYVDKYGSESYGITAFVLNQIRWYSIPLCFIGVAVGALYQYVLGTRRLDMKQKGFALIVAFITILVICQVLPLIFAIVVLGWRG